MKIARRSTLRVHSLFWNGPARSESAEPEASESGKSWSAVSEDRKDSKRTVWDPSAFYYSPISRMTGQGLPAAKRLKAEFKVQSSRFKVGRAAELVRFTHDTPSPGGCAATLSQRERILERRWCDSRTLREEAEPAKAGGIKQYFLG